MQKFNWHVFNVELLFASKTFTFPLHSPLTTPSPSPLSTRFCHCPTPRPHANAHPTQCPPLCHMPPTSSTSSPMPTPTCPPSEEGCIRYVIPALYILDAHAHANAHAHVHAHAHAGHPRACRCSMVSLLTMPTPSSTRRRLVRCFPQDTMLSSHMPVEGSLGMCYPY
jgi:hypothetical protein